MNLHVYMSTFILPHVFEDFVYRVPTIGLDGNFRGKNNPVWRSVM